MEHENDWKEFVADVRNAAAAADCLNAESVTNWLTCCADEIERLRSNYLPVLRRPADVVDRLAAATNIGQTGIAFAFTADLIEAAREIKRLRSKAAVTLTDAEREAIAWSIKHPALFVDDPALDLQSQKVSAALCAMLQRTK